jgi:hypothetical protein
LKTFFVNDRVTRVFLVLALTLMWGGKASFAAEEDPMEILRKAENIRTPGDDYVVGVDLLDSKNGKEEKRTYETSLKGQDKALVKFLTPVSEAGTQVLMVGPDMWVKVPSSAKAVRISAKQKLTGNAAYGDVARLSFLGNYTAKILRSDKFEGKADAWVLDLTSIEDRPVTYDKVEYWVEKKTSRPLKAIYKTASGKVLREGTFGDWQNVFGVERPTRFVLVNSLQSNHVTTLRFENPVRKTLPDLLFERQNLGRQ